MHPGAIPTQFSQQPQINQHEQIMQQNPQMRPMQSHSSVIHQGQRLNAASHLAPQQTSEITIDNSHFIHQQFVSHTEISTASPNSLVQQSYAGSPYTFLQNYEYSQPDSPNNFNNETLINPIFNSQGIFYSNTNSLPQPNMVPLTYEQAMTRMQTIPNQPQYTTNQSGPITLQGQMISGSENMNYQMMQQTQIANIPQPNMQDNNYILPMNVSSAQQQGMHISAGIQQQSQSQMMINMQQGQNNQMRVLGPQQSQPSIRHQYQNSPQGNTMVRNQAMTPTKQHMMYHNPMNSQQHMIRKPMPTHPQYLGQQRMPSQNQTPMQMVPNPSQIPQVMMHGVPYQQQQQQVQSISQPIPTKGPTNQHEMEQIKSELRRLATIYLNSIKEACEKVSQLPEAGSVIKKYHRIIEILEKPESCANLKLTQMNRIESVLKEIKSNPFHLLEYDKTRSKNAQASQQNQQVKPMPPGQTVSQSQQQISGHIKTVPATNLNNLLSQPVASGSPISPATHTGPRPPGYMVQAGSQQSIRMQSGSQIRGTQPQQQMPSIQKQSQIPLASKLMSKLSEDLKKMHDSEKSDPSYAKRLSKIVDEISAETKAFRLTNGYLLPRDLVPSSFTDRKRKNTDENTLSVPSRLNTPFEEKTSEDMKINITAFKKVDSDSTEKTNQNAQDDRLFVMKLEVNENDEKPLNIFPADSIRGLNSRVQIEICEATRKTNFTVIVYSEIHPPTMMRMEDYNSCRSVAEWNSSCHIRFEYVDSRVNTLKFIMPALHVRIPPDYLSVRYLRWFLDESEFDLFSKRQKLTTSSTGTEEDSDDDLNEEFERISIEEEQNQLNKLKKEIERRLHIVERFYSQKMTICLLAKTWCDAINCSLGGWKPVS